MLQKNLDQSLVQPSSARGVLGVQEGFLPYVGDAMGIFDKAWSQTSRITIKKCWIKSNCLANEQALPLTREIQRLSVEGENVSLVENDDQQVVRQIDPNGITLDDPISEAESRHISASVTSASLLGMPQTPQIELLAEVSAISDAANLRAVLKCPAPFDKDEFRHEVSKPNLQEKFDEHGENNAQPDSSAKNLSENKRTNLAYLITAASQGLNEVDDAELKNAFEVLLLRATTLSSDVPQL